MWLVVTEQLLLTGGQLHCTQRPPPTLSSSCPRLLNHSGSTATLPLRVCRSDYSPRRLGTQTYARAIN